MELLERVVSISPDATNVTFPVSVATGSRNRLCFRAFFTSHFNDNNVFCVRNQSHVQVVVPLKPDQLMDQLIILFLNVSSLSWTYPVTVVRGTEYVHMYFMFLRCHIHVGNTTGTSPPTKPPSTTNSSTPTRGICF